VQTWRVNLLSTQMRLTLKIIILLVTREMEIGPEFRVQLTLGARMESRNKFCR
jgi:hypothetical protein